MSSSFDPAAMKASSAGRQRRLSDLLTEGICAMIDI